MQEGRKVVHTISCRSSYDQRVRQGVGARGPVSRVLSPLRGGRPFLWDRARTRSRTIYPEAARVVASASLFDLSPGGVCPANPVTRAAVRSYRTLSPLPPAQEAPGSEAVYSLWHFPWPRGRLSLATTLTRGARTFLPRVRDRTRERPPGPLASGEHSTKEHRDQAQQEGSRGSPERTQSSSRTRALQLSLRDEMAELR